MTFLLRINDHPYVIPDDAVPAVEASILDAAHSGGAFVDVPDAGDTVRVLVTPATSIRIQHAPHPIATAPLEDAPWDLAYFDLDLP